MDALTIAITSLGAGSLTCLLLLALYTLVAQRRAREIKRRDSIQLPQNFRVLVKRTGVPWKRRRFLDLTTPDQPQASQSLGSLTCPYINIRRPSSQTDDNYPTNTRQATGVNNRNDDTSSTVSLCNYPAVSNDFALTTLATRCTASLPTPKACFFALVCPYAA
jgi:hypothetical protein